MTQKILFFDLDGTIMLDLNTVDPHVIDLVRIARANGHKCFVCTSRGEIAIPQVLKDCMDGYIALSGGRCFVDRKLIHDGCLPQEHSQAVIQYCAANNIITLTEGRDNIIFIAYDDAAATQDERDMLPYITHFFNSYEEFMASDASKDVYKFSITKKRLPIFRQCSIIANGTLSLVNAGFGWYEIMGDFSKRDGILRTLAYIRADQDQTICFGDSDNDIPMFETCKYGVAVANALDSLKSRASFVATAPHGLGIEQAMRHYGVVG